MTDVLERVRRGLREHADSIDPTPPPLLMDLVVARRPRPVDVPPVGLVPVARRRPRRAFAPAFAAAAVLLLAVAVVPAVLVGSGPAVAGSVLPREFDVPAHPAALSAEPLSLVVAMLTVEKQVLALGAGGNEYRLVDVPAGPTLLSGDGTKIAAPGTAVEVVDVRTGQSRFYPLDERGGPVPFTPLAWSRDSRMLALSGRGRLTLLDTETGASRAVEAAGAVEVAAFSWDGRLLATQQGPPDTKVTLIDPVDGTLTRQVPVQPGYRIAGQQAWSPDGAVLAVAWNDGGGGAIRYVDMTGGSTDEMARTDALNADDQPPPRGFPSGHFLGWRSMDKIVALRAATIVDSNLDGGGTTVLSTLDRQRIGSLQLAFALLPEIQIVDRPTFVRWLGPAMALILMIGLYLRSRRVGAARGP